jgi:hypothetical protein
MWRNTFVSNHRRERLGEEGLCEQTEKLVLRERVAVSEGASSDYVFDLEGIRRSDAGKRNF